MLKKILDIKSKDIVSIVGAGGKTTMLFNLANELDGKVCITTSTKIFMPKKSNYDYFFSKYPKEILKDGRYLITGEINKSNKLTALSEENLNRLCFDFDYVLIESDGSKCKSLKGWHDNEPVVFEKTTKTIGVLDISVVGKKISNDNIFRLDEFKKLVSHKGDLININHLYEVSTNKGGLTKNTCGEKILFINKVESSEDYTHALNLINMILTSDTVLYDKIVIGSLKNQKYYLMYSGKHISVSVLAAGKSSRMGEDKLCLDFNGLTLLEKTMESIKNIYFKEKLLITNNNGLKLENMKSKPNHKYKLGQCESIKLSIENDMDAYLILVGDQPFIKRKTILEIISKYNETDKIIMCKSNLHIGNPTLIPYRYKKELFKLKGDIGAKSILKKYASDTCYVEVNDNELIDIDTMEDYNYYRTLEE